MVNSMKIIIAMVILLLLSPCAAYSEHDEDLAFLYLQAKGLVQASHLQGHYDGYIRVLRALAAVMGDYEYMESVEERRDRLTDILRAAIHSEKNMVTLYSVWAPNALDNMDSRQIGRPDSTFSGQYAPFLDKRTGHIELRVGLRAEHIDEHMRYINGPSGKEYVEDPVPGMVMGRETYLLRMAVPITNPLTWEAVGYLGCLVDTGSLQRETEMIVRDNPEIAAMEIYSNDGLILASHIYARQGTMLSGEDALYGIYSEAALEAVLHGRDFYGAIHHYALKIDLNVTLSSFVIGDSRTTWTVMIAMPASPRHP